MLTSHFYSNKKSTQHSTWHTTTFTITYTKLVLMLTNTNVFTHIHRHMHLILSCSYKYMCAISCCSWRFFFFFFLHKHTFFVEKITIANCKLTNAIKVCGSCWGKKNKTKKLKLKHQIKSSRNHTNLKHTLHRCTVVFRIIQR